MTHLLGMGTNSPIQLQYAALYVSIISCKGKLRLSPKSLLCLFLKSMPILAPHQHLAEPGSFPFSEPSSSHSSSFCFVFLSLLGSTGNFLTWSFYFVACSCIKNEGSAFGGVYSRPGLQILFGSTDETEAIYCCIFIMIFETAPKNRLSSLWKDTN